LGNKTKPSLKVSKDKTKVFLGKKRNNEKSVKSKTPDKLRNKSPSQTLNQKPIEISNSPIKIRSGSSKTPTKSASKKMRNILPVNVVNSSKVNSISEIAIVTKLNKLIKEYGFEKVLDAVCKAKLNQKNKLEQLVQGLKDTINNEKLPLFLIKMLFTYFNDKIENKDVVANIHISEEKDKDKDKKKEKENNKKLINALKSLTAENNNNVELNEITEKLISKSPTKSSTYSKTNNKKNNVEVVPMELDDQVVNAIHLTDEDPTNNPQPQKKEKKTVVSNQAKKKVEKEKTEKSPIKIQNDEPKKEKKNMSIGSHYHKDEEGHVYKYQVCKLDGEGNAIFKCYDDKCSGEGMYNLDTRIFKVSKKHNLKHEEHDYIISYDKSEDNIFKEMKNMNKKDAQVFKEANVRTVKIY